MSACGWVHERYRASACASVQRWRKIVFSQKESTTNSIDESILRSPGAKTQVKLNDLFQKRNENNFVSQDLNFLVYFK